MRRLIRVDGAAPRRIMAHVFGAWAAHPTVSRDGGWDVTHVRTGRRIRSVTGPLTRPEALAVARGLARRVKDPMADQGGAYIIEAVVAETLEGTS